MSYAELLPVAICVDCAMWAANRDDSGASPEWAALVDRPMSDPTDPRTVRDYVGTLIVESGDDTEHFSWSACHGCGSPLGGTRLDAFEPAGGSR